jgi:hypothetical protein
LMLSVVLNPSPEDERDCCIEHLFVPYAVLCAREISRIDNLT